MGQGRIGLGVRNENSEGGGKVGGYKNPRTAYCLRRRPAMVGGGARLGIRWAQWGREDWDKQDRFYSSLGIIPGARRSYIALTLSGLPNYSSSPFLPSHRHSVSFLRLEKCSFTLFIVFRLSSSLGRSRHYFPLVRKKRMRRYSLPRLIFPCD